MTSPLSAIAVEKRRQFAATLGLFSMLFIAVGAVAATGASTAVVKAFVVIALIIAVALGLMAWGVLHSVKLDLGAQRLDAAIEAAVVSRGGSMCDCGHEHDPDELHVVDDPCAKDGHGVGCTHSCDTCVVASMRRAARPSPVVASQRSRPSPYPRTR
ncbi:MAG: hypothetical protein QOC66_2750 [Pseudonocardiales bacterium]|nr:hypothetical protein [Pseudonocardiales bacterium]